MNHENHFQLHDKRKYQRMDTCNKRGSAMNWFTTLPSSVRAVADKCSAPLCIVHQHYINTNTGNGGINHALPWFPDEEICSCYRKKAVQNYLHFENGTAPLWITRQHNIAKYVKKKGLNNEHHYFTYEMLCADRIIKGSTKGINPDKEPDVQFARFFKYCNKEVA